MEIRPVAFCALSATVILALEFGSAAAESDWVAITKRCAAEFPGNQAKQVSCITEERDVATSHHDDAAGDAAKVSHNPDQPCTSQGTIAGYDCGPASGRATAH
jgi:hypothetical protein